MPLTIRPLRTRAATLVAAPALAVTAGLLSSAVLADPPSSRHRLPGHTIVAVEGDAENGFSVFRLDGSSEHPPTLSESTAECHEHDDPTDVAVCLAEVETRFEGLTDVQLSLRWAAGRRGGPGPR
ncbi:hypothetical protein [Aeromicrobium sp. Leaf245]|uniref:hypothetical protein n=1 Tax=Aeromicrobium sp. Leaf245 TaxID=1736306 RepID=UPI0007007736|nr:hypothetical protein [Aeromicrobium sp. Leaf245]KQO36248.1 hypothetical protein ASF05_08615 [Aeromicrobium sp. Leaf245]